MTKAQPKGKYNQFEKCLKQAAEILPKAKAQARTLGQLSKSRQIQSGTAATRQKELSSEIAVLNGTTLRGPLLKKQNKPCLQIKVSSTAKTSVLKQPRASTKQQHRKLSTRLCTPSYRKSSKKHIQLSEEERDGPEAESKDELLKEVEKLL